MMKAAIVGLGWWGRQITGALKGSEKIRIVRGVDVNLAAARPFGEANGFPVTDRYEDALKDKGVDAVILVTPHLLHEEQVLAAAKAGKQIFCEKPFTLTAAGARRMAAACRKRGITLGIGHERRFEPALVHIKRMLDSGDLGTLLHLEYNSSYNLFAKTGATGWRRDPKQAPAGTLTAHGVHITDYLQSIAGPVAEVTARTAHRSKKFVGDDIVMAQFVFRSGVTGTMTNIATTPYYHRFVAFGDRSWVELRLSENLDIPQPAIVTWRGVDEEHHSRSFRWSDTVRPNLEEWADAVEGRGRYRHTAEQIVHNVEILEAIVNSAAADGKAVRIGKAVAKAKSAKKK